MRRVASALYLALSLAPAGTLAQSTDVVQIGPWRIPIVGVFQESRDERGLVLTRPDGEQIVCRFVPGERPTERGEAARRRLAIVEELARMFHQSLLYGPGGASDRAIWAFLMV
jgi:hypothetical protein